MSSPSFQKPSGKILRIYKCSFMSTSFLMPNGKPCIFVNGVYRTDSPAEIAEFDKMIAEGHPHFYVDPNEREVDSAFVDPMAMMRHRIIEEYKASQAAASNPNNDMGTSDQSMKLNVATTRNIEEAAAGGSGSGLAARLMKIAPAQLAQNTGTVSSATGQPILNVPVVSLNQ